MKKILILEDDPGSSETIGDVITFISDDYVVITAESIAEAEQMLHRHPDTALLVVDGNVPEQPGSVGTVSTAPFVKQLREEGFSGFIIAFPGDEAVLSRLLAAGCDAGVTKPDAIELGEIIQRLLRGSG